ncbi:beta-N-acetylhexosaminidase [Mucilaginibacter gotjawali]|uniref:Hexosaminidase n=1 Tax=Mucilaginibacter gotjawali TaxID=1550579 RepID=A0A839SBA8_9SPHI|nr:family 20 glycosylhydrolase [Mucilaginibacter gotjawali]MBB3054533.1 hexosaminidase [Mucilaginibacter gotjawali]
MRIIFTTLLIFSGLLSAGAQAPDSLNLMPRPQAVKLQTGKFVFTGRFAIGINGPGSPKLIAAANRFYLTLGKRTGVVFPQEYISGKENPADAQLTISYQKSINAAIGMDESYTLTVTPEKIALTAPTDIGAGRGLETLYQLVTPAGSGFYCPAVEINDVPRFKWRGLMIDVARHFIPFDVLKRNVDAMAIVKMNVLHLHLSDDEGFRVESKVYPKLQENGSNGSFYTQDQVKELVNYAHDRGIIIVPEFDLPGHCSSILAAYPFLASYPASYKPARRFNVDTIKNPSLGKIMQLINQTQTPTIDPTKETTYVFFDRFFKEMSGIFPDAYLHVGADENNGVAWKQNPQIAAFMKAKSMKTTDDLQAYFVNRMHGIAQKYNKRIIGWEETFNATVPQDVIIQKWKPAAPADTLVKSIVGHHNQVIVSAGYYLDLYFPAYIHYLTDPVPANLTATAADKGILGGEAAMWSELVDGGNEEIRVWPRTAAIAERFWSAAGVRDADDMYRRLWAVDFELNDRAVNEYGNYIKIPDRWVNDEDLNPAITLCNVYTQVKGYKRLMAALLSPGEVHAKTTLTTPLVGIADAVHTDSETGWYFRHWVATYLDKHDAASLAQIKSQLQRWQSNKARFDALAANSPYLQQIADLSDNLSNAAGIALQALNNEGIKDDQLKQLQQLEKPHHDVQLAIGQSLEALVTGKLKPEPAAYSMF